MGQLKYNGMLSNGIPISNGIRKGCVFTLVLFSIFFTMMLPEAKEGQTETKGIYTQFQTECSLFNQHCLMSHKKTSEEHILKLLFADDCTLLAHTKAALQYIINCSSVVAKAFELMIILKKTDVLYQPLPQVAYHPPHISTYGIILNETQHFMYLASIISNEQTLTVTL